MFAPQVPQRSGGSGPGKPGGRRPRPTRPPDRELKQRALAALVLGTLAMVALLSFNGDLRRGVYVLGFSALIGTAALVIGITALRKARRTDVYRPRGAFGAIFLGAMAMLLTMPILAAYALLPTQVGNYMRCLSQAQSSSAQQTCVDQLFKSINTSKP